MPLPYELGLWLWPSQKWDLSISFMSSRLSGRPNISTERQIHQKHVSLALAAHCYASQSGKLEIWRRINLNVSCLWCLSKWRSCWLRVSSSSNVSDSQQTLFPPARRIINYSTALSSAVRHRVIAIKWKLIFIYDSPDTSKYLQATLVLIPIASQG